MITFIIPVYNGEQFLRDCLKSVCTQTLKDIEILVINDGSTDSSESIATRFAQNDPRISVVSKKNGGVSSARNLGLSLAKGEWIAFVDCDDIIAPNYAETLLNNSSSTLTAIGGFRCFDGIPSFTDRIEKKQEIHIIPWVDYINGIFKKKYTFPTVCCMLFRHLTITDYSIAFDEDTAWGEDREFLLKYLTYTEGSISLIDKTLYFYRQLSSSAMHTVSLNALSAINADKRLTELFNSTSACIEGIRFIVPRTILKLAFLTAKAKNREVYNNLDRKHDIKKNALILIHSDVLSHKLLAYVYILLGNNYFYKFISMMRKI